LSDGIGQPLLVLVVRGAGHDVQPTLLEITWLVLVVRGAGHNAGWTAVVSQIS